MKLTFHMVRTDLVRMRAWIACWVGVLLLPIGVGVMLLTKNPLSDEEWRVADMLAILTGLELCVGYVLTIVLVHEHGLVGTRQFWLTRPISRGRLLAAKAIGALIIVGLVPVAVSLPWWWWCGFGASQMLQAAAEMIAVFTLAVLAGALVATLTDSFARALLWTLVLVAVGLVTVLFFAVVNAARVHSDRDMTVLVSRGVLAVVVLAVETAAVVAFQYFVRRRGWWLGAAVGIVMVSFVAVSQVSWSLFEDELRERSPERAAEARVRLMSARAEPLTAARSREEIRRGRELSQRVGTWVGVAGLPPELILVGGQTRHRWLWSEGAVIERESYVNGGSDPLPALGLRWTWPTDDPETQRWVSERRSLMPESLRPVENPELGPNEVSMHAQAHLRPSVVARMQEQPPRYEARWWFWLVRPEMEIELPLEPGGWRTRENGIFRVDRIERKQDRVNFVVVDSRPRLPSTIVREAARAHSWVQYMRGREQGLLVINRSVGNTASPRLRERSPQNLIVHGVDIRWRALTVDAPRIVRDGRWIAVADWLDGLTLAGLIVREEVVFARDVKAASFELKE